MIFNNKYDCNDDGNFAFENFFGIWNIFGLNHLMTKVYVH